MSMLVSATCQCNMHHVNDRVVKNDVDNDEYDGGGSGVGRSGELS